MLICVNCHRELRCDKNGVSADFGRGHVYPADRFICDGCGLLILSTNPAPIFDPEHITQDEYLTMPVEEAA
jgi:hypothetical protein